MDPENPGHSVSDERRLSTRFALPLCHVLPLPNTQRSSAAKTQRRSPPGTDFSSCSRYLGELKRWSMVIYGTAEQPYTARRRRARSAETPMDSDLTEEYSGESSARLFLQLRPLTEQPNTFSLSTKFRCKKLYQRSEGLRPCCPNCSLTLFYFVIYLFISVPFQDPATQSAVTMVARGPAPSSVSRVCTFFSSSRTTQG